MKASNKISLGNSFGKKVDRFFTSVQ